MKQVFVQSEVICNTNSMQFNALIAYCCKGLKRKLDELGSMVIYRFSNNFELVLYWNVLRPNGQWKTLLLKHTAELDSVEFLQK